MPIYTSPGPVGVSFIHGLLNEVLEQRKQRRAMGQQKEMLQFQAGLSAEEQANRDRLLQEHEARRLAAEQQIEKAKTATEQNWSMFGTLVNSVEGGAKVTPELIQTAQRLSGQDEATVTQILSGAEQRGSTTRQQQFLEIRSRRAPTGQAPTGQIYKSVDDAMRDLISRYGKDYEIAPMRAAAQLAYEHQTDPGIFVEQDPDKYLILTREGRLDKRKKYMDQMDETLPLEVRKLAADKAIDENMDPDAAVVRVQADIGAAKIAKIAASKGITVDLNTTFQAQALNEAGQAVGIGQIVRDEAQVITLSELYATLHGNLDDAKILDLIAAYFKPPSLQVRPPQRLQGTSISDFYKFYRGMYQKRPKIATGAGRNVKPTTQGQRQP